MRLIISEENGGFNLPGCSFAKSGTPMGELLSQYDGYRPQIWPCLAKTKERNTDTVSKGSRISVLGSSLEFYHFESFWGIKTSDILLLFLYGNNAGRHEMEQKFYLNNNHKNSTYLLITFKKQE